VRRYGARLRSIAIPSSFTPAIGAILATRTLTPWRAEVAHQQVGDGLRESLEELVRVIGGKCLRRLTTAA
jgi:hypothetical protein